MGGQCLVYAARLARGRRTNRAWVLVFAATGVAALCGAAHHALWPGQAPRLRAGLWKAAGLCTVFASSAFIAATLLRDARGMRRAVGRSLLAAKWLLVARYFWQHDAFRVLVIDYLVAMALLLGAQVRQRRDPAAGWLAGGVVVTIAGAVIQQRKWALHRHFNHNDLFHVVQMGANYLFYRGACAAGERSVRDVASDQVDQSDGGV
jgi:hypothetical protein